MSYFPSFKLTKLGEQLVNKINGNLSETLNIKRVEIGGGDISNVDEIRFLTSLKQKICDAKISNHEVVKGEDGKTKTIIEIQFTNKDFLEEKPFKEIGIYAAGNDGIEVLFLYTNALDKFDNIPAENDNPHTIVINLVMQVTTDAKINAVIDLSAYVTTQTFNKFKENLETRLRVIEAQNEQADTRLTAIEKHFGLEPREAALGDGYLGNFYLG